MREVFDLFVDEEEDMGEELVAFFVVGEGRSIEVIRSMGEGESNTPRNW